MKNYHFYLILFFLLKMPDPVEAQEPLHRHYTNRDGLPSSTIFQMIQDKDGFIWMGTDAGVTRFDGKTFRNFTLADGLSDNFILNVKIDSKNRIWFLGLNGTVSYWLDGKIYNASSDTLLKKIIASTAFIDLFEDDKKRLWFLSQGECIIFNNSNSEIIHIGKQITLSIIINSSFGPLALNRLGFQNESAALSTDFTALRFTPINRNGYCGYWRLKDESIFFPSEEGIVWQKDTTQKLIIPFHGEFKEARIGSISFSSDSLIWVSVSGKGIYCYDIRNPKKTPVIYLKEKITNAILNDNEGNVWMSTKDDGLYMSTPLGRKIKLIDQSNGLLANTSAIFKNKRGELLVGNIKGKMQLILDNKITEINMPVFPINNKEIYRILSKDDDIWIAAEGGVIHQNRKTGCNHLLNDPSPTSVHKQITNVKDITLGLNKIYIATGWNIFEYPLDCKANSGYWARSISKKRVRNYCIYYSYSHELWYATINGLHSAKDTTFIDHSGEDMLLSKRINAIAETDDSVLVLATHGHGILFYKNGKIIHRVTTANGLCNDICFTVFVYKNRIYISSSSGVSVLFYDKGKVTQIQNINAGNYLPSDEVNGVCADDKEITVSTAEGISVIGQWALEKINPGIPLLHITDIKLQDSAIASDRIAILPYDKNSLKFNFIGIYYQQPNDVNYRYRIKDDQPWQPTKNTELEFSFLSPGKYVFQLQARIGEAAWTQMQTFQFNISPPFWKTYWFIFMEISAIVLIIFFVVKVRLRLVRKNIQDKVKVENQITQLEQQALQTMMNPHFIFNVMNSIQFFINANEKESANHYLTEFASLIRMNLSISFKRFISLDEEIEYLNLYLKFEKLRFGDNLTYEIFVDPEIEIDETTIAVMMIQPFLENAIWHGILPNLNKGVIAVKIFKESNNVLRIIVEDNGIGIHEKFIGDKLDHPLNESHALSMTLQRMNLLGKFSGQKLYLKYKHMFPELENKGTIVEFLLPTVMY